MRWTAWVGLGVLLPLSGCRNDLVVEPAVVPPAPVTDLRAEPPVTESYDSNIRLRWTAPATPAGGAPARQYEIRVSTHPLVGDQWLEAAPALVLRAAQPLGAEGTVLVSGLRKGKIHFFVLRSADAGLHWSAWSNVAALATQNSPPFASFTIGPDSTCPRTPISVDAGSCVDDDDARELLEVRWDWEDDGTWDTEWSPVKNATHAYHVPRTYTVRLEVRDTAGGAAQVTHSIRRGPVLLRSAVRNVRVWEEIPHCWPEPPRDPQQCVWSPVPRDHVSQAYGRYSSTLPFADQTSRVETDTLQFTGGMRAGIAWPYHSMSMTYEVVFDVCVTTPYHLHAHSDCPPGSLRIEGASWVVYSLDGCGDADYSGQLSPGVYRVRAELATDGDFRMSFQLVFGSEPSMAFRSAGLRAP